MWVVLGKLLGTLFGVNVTVTVLSDRALEGGSLWVPDSGHRRRPENLGLEESRLPCLVKNCCQAGEGRSLACRINFH